MVERSRSAGLATRPEVQERFNPQVQRKLDKGGLDPGWVPELVPRRPGRERTLWPGFTWRYWLATRKIRPADFELIGTAGGK